MESKRQRNVAAKVENGIYKIKKFARVAEINRQRIYGNFAIAVFTGSLRIDCQGASTERVSEVSVLPRSRRPMLAPFPTSTMTAFSESHSPVL